MYKVIIIGTGPAGIAMGAELVQAGISSKDIVLLEKSEHDNASVRQFYPATKDINSVYKNMEIPQKGIVGFSGLIKLDEYHALMNKEITENNLNIKFKVEAQKVVKTDNGFEVHTSEGVLESEYVVLSSGVFAKPRKPDYPIPAPLLKKISYDIVQLQRDKAKDLDILVVGGGDSASEYVQTLAEMGNSVSLSYRQDKIFRMNELNIERLYNLVDKNLAKVCLGTNITGLEEIEGRIKVSFQELEPMIVDRIVYSLGGSSPSGFMAACGLNYDENDVKLRDYNETEIDGLFLIGDLSAGRKGGSLLYAFNGARSVMEGLHTKYSFPTPANN